MAGLSIRNVSEDTVSKLRVRAAQRGLSMEAEVRDMLDKVANGARIVPNFARPSVDERVAKVQAMVQARLGEFPRGRVDALIAERKAAAERGE